MPELNHNRVVSLYSGAGGLDLGFARAGFELVWANEIDRDAAATYSNAFGSHMHCGDIRSVGIPRGINADVVVGGPPCQGFSVIGKMDRNDPRSKHVLYFLDVVEQIGAQAFVLENVKALAVNTRWSGVLKALTSRAEDMGFCVETFVLNAADFGVPQARERMFMIGLKHGEPRRPSPTTRNRPPTVRETLAQLPPYGSPGNDGFVSARVVPAKEPIMRPTAYRGSLLFNGSGRPLDLDGTAMTIPASMGGNGTPIVDQEELASGRAPWVVEYHARLQRGGRPRRTAPKRLRRITVQEAAALQTFPPDFRFEGSLVSQLRQIGNAVPPNLAFCVASAVRESLANVDHVSSLKNSLAAA